MKSKPTLTSITTKPKPLKICFSDQKDIFDIF